MKNYITEYEAAIEAWLEEALSTEGEEEGYYIVTGDEINAICNLALRAPRPEPKPEPRASSEMDRLRRAREHYKGECKRLRKERDEAIDRTAAALALREDKAMTILNAWYASSAWTIGGTRGFKQRHPDLQEYLKQELGEA